MMNVPWSKPSNHFTALFEARVINWLKVASIHSRVSDRLKLSWNTVDGIMQRAVKRGLSHADDIENLTQTLVGHSRGHTWHEQQVMPRAE